MKVIYLASRYGLEEVEVVKETKKQYKLGSNLAYRATLNKDLLDIYLGVGMYGDYIFSESKEECIRAFNKLCKMYEKEYRNSMEKWKGRMINE